MSDHVLGGRYRLQRRLGHGATATVWQACDTRLDRGAAVKILDGTARADPAALERLRREARSVARLTHDHIVGVYDVDIADDAAYLVMELVDGQSLREVIAMQRRLPVAQAVSIGVQICDALGAAHAAGVVHRDIKPSNILVDASGLVKVCDFGVALLDRAAGDAALTGAGSVVGTCQYMAPEQAAGDPIDGRADLYAVGCVLYAMLTGAPPFNADHPIDVLELHLSEPPVPLRAHRADVPADLQRLMDEMLAKHAIDRPVTAWSVRDRLRAIGESASPVPAAAALTMTLPTAVGRPEGNNPRTTVLPTPHARRRRRSAPDRATLLAAAAIATVMLATALVVTLSAVGERPDRPAGKPAPAASKDTATAEAASPEPSSALAAKTSPAPQASTATSAPVRARPIDQLAGLATLLQREADTGRLRPKVAKALLRQLEGAARALNAGQTAEAAGRFDDFRERVSELDEQGQLADVALPDLDGIAASLRAG
ncbi:protein kinase [Actinoplanes sp. NPDC051513]|uniref:serine/threonine-protein kinase n=1 Tax=Actinoplanes sp. NPDC051513 TaxID=3363908 RepID=UPI0037A1C0C1